MNTEILKGMTVSVEEAEQMSVELSIQIPYQLIEPEMRKEILDIKKQYHPPGFRKNHVPFEFIKKKFGKDIFNDLTQKITQEALTHALEEKGMSYIRQPKVDYKTRELGSPFEFTATFERMPEFDEIDLSAIELVQPEVDISKDAIESKLSDLKRQFPEWSDTEEESKQGSRVVIDYDGTIEGEPFEGGHAEKQAAIIGDSSYLPDFEQALVGRRKDDEFTFPLTFPSDYFKPTLAGKVADFTIKIHSVEEAKPVTMSKAFYARCGIPVTKKTEFMDAINQRLSYEVDAAKQRYRQKNLYEWLDSHYDFELPANLVSDEFSRQAQSKSDEEKASIIEDIINNKDPLAVEARKAVKISILMKSISDRAGLKVEEQDVESYFASLGLPQDQVVQYANWFLNDTARSASLFGTILEKKSVAYALDRVSNKSEFFAYKQFMSLVEEGA